MSDPQQPPLSPPVPARSSAGPESLEVCTATPQARLVTAAAMLASMGVYALLWEGPVWGRLVLVGSAAALILTRSETPVVAILIWAWGAPVLMQGKTIFADDQLGTGDLLAAMALAAFVLFALRCIELQRRPLRDADGRQLPNLLLRPFSGAALRIALAPVLAILLLWLAPWEAMTRNAVRLVPSFYRTILFFWFLAVAALLAATGFSMWKWRRLTPRQAGVYLRWVLSYELRREHPAIERARDRHWRKQR
jgi:hypothetical protein